MTLLLTGQPVARRSRKLSGKKLKAAKEEIDFLLEQEIIHPSSSWASPIHLGFSSYSAYHQISMNPDDCIKTAIIKTLLPRLFKYIVMPFGLRNTA
ncbi:hypothetical protein WN51_07966 [Melipona quadrifasciata]|uniref:Uncharacterized protein n=1 Tax=Melipona quadrifasciata TaxID=166423 RepID=A0A0M8ZP82_9HYME|nr:hypothetical protein WN51_07966 [Melipona quadrifasciata]